MANNNLPGLTKLQNINLNKFLTDAALLVEADAKVNCPVDTGSLRSSITHNVYADYAEVGTNYDYAPYVEFGTGLWAAAGDGRKTPWTYQDSKGEWHTTVGQHPQPYLQPALTKNKSKILKLLSTCITEEVK